MFLAAWTLGTLYGKISSPVGSRKSPLTLSDASVAQKSNSFSPSSPYTSSVDGLTEPQRNNQSRVCAWRSSPPVWGWSSRSSDGHSLSWRRSPRSRPLSTGTLVPLALSRLCCHHTQSIDLHILNLWTSDCRMSCHCSTLHNWGLGEPWSMRGLAIN